MTSDPYHAAAERISQEVERHTEWILQACKDCGVDVLGVQRRHNGRSVIAQNGMIVGGVDVVIDLDGHTMTVAPSFVSTIIADAYRRCATARRDARRFR